MMIYSLFMLSLLAQTPTPVVISTDSGCEMDDQWAITHLCLAPTLQVTAIITAHAPKFPQPRAEFSANVARNVVAVLPESRRPPVIAGAHEPLVDRKTPQKSAGSERLIVESRGFSAENRLTVVQIGPATDVASALLIDPTIVDRIKVVAMAFDEWPRGDDPFNVKNDVKAWKVLIESRVPLVVVDGAVTKLRLTLTREQATQRFGDAGPIGKTLVNYLNSWLDRAGGMAQAVTGSRDAWPVWDCGTVAVLLGYAKIAEHPRPSLRDDLTFDHAHTRGTIGWVTEIDGGRLWDDLAKRAKDAR